MGIARASCCDVDKLFLWEFAKYDVEYTYIFCILCTYMCLRLIYRFSKYVYVYAHVSYVQCTQINMDTIIVKSLTHNVLYLNKRVSLK